MPNAQPTFERFGPRQQAVPRPEGDGVERGRRELPGGERTFERMVEVGRALVEEDGADAIVLGCAGMARHRRPLEATLGVPVVDPTQTAVTMAIGAVLAEKM